MAPLRVTELMEPTVRETKSAAGTDVQQGVADEVWLTFEP